MASGDNQRVPKHMTYTQSGVPVVGALIDYLVTSYEYFRRKTFTQAERLRAEASKASLSATFLAGVCLLLGLVCNVKFEVVTYDEEPLPNDLHFMLLSRDDKLYIDDIDLSKVMWCIEASDTLVILISSLLIWNASNVRSPLSEYLFLPWLGATLRGLFLRQAPTAGALIYTIAVINGNVNPLFLTTFSFLFLLEARLWLEIARLVRVRWERNHFVGAPEAHYEVETLWSNEDVQSIEVGNFVY
ncbi:hypothetical protein KGM_210876 [Danaus plexippus plexippus]|uniref:Uncharacterized protein n=1 Tax=Danaus plexippus plexippus TaxID=278856 RepID=A0A212FCW6_DANPL|nr:uncharacterized protein LOC116774870 [Danaus plexippus plexippus]OWR51589.1 hypothetical protein KGM_210876 [Danaus plexippus plexippus]